MSTRLTKDDVVDAFVDSIREAWPIPIPGLGIVITAFAAKLGVKPIKLQDTIVRRSRDDEEMRRSCGGKCCDRPGTPAVPNEDSSEWACDCSCHSEEA